MMTPLQRDSQVKVLVLLRLQELLNIILSFLYREEATQTLYQQQIADPAAAAGVVLHDGEVN